MGWCSAGSHGEQCSKDDCLQVGGTYSETPGNGGCDVIAPLPDEFAREIVETSVWPPVAVVRDVILPRHRAGSVMVSDFDQHFGEIVAIVGRNPKLLMEIIRFTSAMGPYLRALAGQTVPDDGSLSKLTSTRLRPGMVEWTADILRSFDGKASSDLKATIKRYVALLPSLQNLTPAELLATLDDPRTASRLQRAA